MNKKTIKKVILLTSLPLIIATPFLGIAANKLENTNQFHLGFEILMKNNVDQKTLLTKLKDFLKTKNLENQIDYKVFEFTNKLTILTVSNNKSAFEKALKSFFQNNTNSLNAILIDEYLINSSEEEKILIQNNDSKHIVRDYLSKHKNIINNYKQASTHKDGELNSNNFEYIGLDKAARYFHFKNTFNELGKLSVGVSEVYKLKEDNLGKLSWNYNHGLLNLKYDSNNVPKDPKDLYNYHSNAVAEILTGSNGINQTIEVKTLPIDRALSEQKIKNLKNLKTFLINNSYGYTAEFINDNPKYNKYNHVSKFLDEIIVKNPELIYVFAAGNVREYNRDNIKVSFDSNYTGDNLPKVDPISNPYLLERDLIIPHWFSDERKIELLKRYYMESLKEPGLVESDPYFNLFNHSGLASKPSGTGGTPTSRYGWCQDLTKDLTKYMQKGNIPEWLAKDYENHCAISNDDKYYMDDYYAPRYIERRVEKKVNIKDGVSIINSRIDFNLNVYNSKNELVKKVNINPDFNVEMAEFIADGETYRIEVSRTDISNKGADVALTFVEDLNNE